jgi:HEAT repeat protein
MPVWPNKPAKFYLAALRDPDHRVRRQAAAALEVLGEQRAVKPLMRLLRADDDKEVRGNAARALGRLGDLRATQTLIHALEDSDGHVRANATAALAKLGDARAVEPLIALLQDPDENVCYHAVIALGKLGDERAVKPLVKVLRRDSGNLGATIAAVVGQFGSALPLLLEALEHEKKEVRRCAVQALAFSQDHRAREPLRNALNDADPEVRAYAAWALGMLR